MRKFIWIALAALSAASLAQNAKVTYTTVAVSAKKAIADLAQKTGMKIECSPAMDKEILILRLNDAPMDEVMRQIAIVTAGTWSKEGETIYLVANGGARQLEANKILQRDAAAISATLKKTIDSFEKPKTPVKGAKTNPDDPPQDMPMPGFFGGGMMGDSAVMAKIAMAIGPLQLASVPEGGRVVFSTNPTGMQRSLSGSASQYINQFVVEYNKMAAMAKQDEPAKNDGDEQMAAMMELFGNKMKKPKPITQPPSKAIVVASRRGMFFGYTLDLKLYDAAGKILATNSMPLMTNMPFDMAAMAKPGAAPPKNEGPELKLSPMAAELYKANNSLSFRGGSSQTKLSKELMDVMRDPVAHDPLSFVQSECLIQIAEGKNEQLVADLPDGVASFFDNLTQKGTLTADSFLKQIKGNDKAAILESNGWMIVSPANGVKSRKERTDRVALRNFIGTAESKGYVALDDVAAYATKNESPMDGAPASAAYVILFAPGALQQGMMGQVNWDMLRFYGLLESSQKDTLRQGARIAYGRLTSGQQSQISKMLFGADENLVVETRQSANKPKDDPLTEMINSQMDRFGGGNDTDFRTEPTEVMPSGLPQDGYLVVKFATEPIGQPQTMSTDFGRGFALGPMEFGLFKFFKEDPQMAAMAGQMPTMDDIKVGSRSVYNFSFYAANAVCEKQTLNDDSIPKDAAVYKMANLPSDFQKKIDDMATSMKKNPIWKMMGKMGGLGQGTPPPQN